jgi:hypothetical protein
MRTTSTGKSKRSFTVVDAKKSDGCKTKFVYNKNSGTFVSSSPDGAAKKAVSKLCKKKKTSGTCTFIVTMKETTQNSKGKLYSYKVRRERADTEGPFGNMYVNKAKSVKTTKSVKCPKSKKTKKNLLKRLFRK